MWLAEMTEIGNGIGIAGAIVMILLTIINLVVPRITEWRRQTKEAQREQQVDVKEGQAQTIALLQKDVQELKEHNKVQDADMRTMEGKHDQEMQSLQQKHADCEKREAARDVAEFYMKRDIAALESQVAKLQAWKEQHGGSDVVKNA